VAQIESLATSPYFAIFLGIVGLWLFVLLSREFSFWYFKIGYFEKELKEIRAQLEEINKNLSKPSPIKEISLPPIPKLTSVAPDPERVKNQFPVQH
jgi:hypothetical protein